MKKPAGEPKRTAPIQRRRATDDEARALASTLRVRILRVCSEPRTNKEIAAALGRDPATVLHHVRRLVDTGFLAAQEARRGVAGKREIPYLATGMSWHVDAPSNGLVLLDTFLEEVGQIPVESIQTTRLGLRLTEAERREFDTQLFDLLDKYATRHESPDGQAISLFLAIHPDPARPGRANAT